MFLPTPTEEEKVKLSKREGILKCIFNWSPKAEVSSPYLFTEPRNISSGVRAMIQMS
jgi:hypothetical protein